MNIYIVFLLSFLFFQCSPEGQTFSGKETTPINVEDSTSSIVVENENVRGISSVNDGRPGIKLCNTSSVDVIGREYIESLKDHLNQWVDNVGEAFEGLIDKVENCSGENDYWVKSSHKEFKTLSKGCHRYICMELLDLTKDQLQGLSTSNALKERARLEVNLDNK